jgi:hypothetical protein
MLVGFALHAPNGMAADKCHTTLHRQPAGQPPRGKLYCQSKMTAKVTAPLFIGRSKVEARKEILPDF